jgi:CheY-like chemotaxis protein
MFAQVDRSMERSHGGLGIGLSLVQRLVKLHGGSVEAHSKGAGQGSAFVVHLPVLDEMHEIVMTEPTTAAPAPAGCNILVVDDNRDAASSLAVLLKNSGNQTYLAHDGLAAVEAAKRLKPDVVLLDIGLPKMNGYDVCRAIRHEPWGKKMVIVALTGWGQEDDRRRSSETGFDAHLVKPVEYAELSNLLAEIQLEPV